MVSKQAKKQALDYILDLSVDHRDVRSLFKHMDAVKLISNIHQLYSSFRFGDGYHNNLLLTSSRNALVSLQDSELNTLLHEWGSAVVRMTQASARETLNILWSKIAPFLWWVAICTSLFALPY